MKNRLSGSLAYWTGLFSKEWLGTTQASYPLQTMVSCCARNHLEFSRSFSCHFCLLPASAPQQQQLAHLHLMSMTQKLFHLWHSFSRTISQAFQMASLPLLLHRFQRNFLRPDLLPVWHYAGQLLPRCSQPYTIWSILVLLGTPCGPFHPKFQYVVLFRTQNRASKAILECIFQAKRRRSERL